MQFLDWKKKDRIFDLNYTFFHISGQCAESAQTSPMATAEEFFNKDVQIVNTIKQLQRGAKSITVTFTSIDK